MSRKPEHEIRQLSGLSLEGLRADWRRRFQADPPTCKSTSFLRGLIA